MQHFYYLYIHPEHHISPHSSLDLDLEVIGGKSDCGVLRRRAWLFLTGGPLLLLGGQHIQLHHCGRVDPAHHSSGAPSPTITELERELAQDTDDFQRTAVW